MQAASILAKQGVAQLVNFNPLRVDRVALPEVRSSLAPLVVLNKLAWNMDRRTKPTYIMNLLGL